MTNIDLNGMRLPVAFLYLIIEEEEIQRASERSIEHSTVAAISVSMHRALVRQVHGEEEE